MTTPDQNLEAAETALTRAIENGAGEDELYALDAATIGAELAARDARNG